MGKKKKSIDADMLLENNSNDLLTKTKIKKNKSKPHEINNSPEFNNEMSNIANEKIKIKKSKKRKLQEEENVDEIDTEENSSKNEKSKKKKVKLEQSSNDDKNHVSSSEECEEEPNDIDKNDVKQTEEDTQEHEEEDGVLTKKPPRKSGETKKQYKRRIRLLRETGQLVDPIVDETTKKEKRNRKTRKEKRMAIEKKNDELDKYRNIIQLKYLKQWKNERDKWKFNKNVQGKLFKHMFNTSKMPNDMFEILIEYISQSKSDKVHQDINKKCSQVIEEMEKWTSSSEEQKKKLTEPSSDSYERARQVLQSLA